MASSQPTAQPVARDWGEPAVTSCFEVKIQGESLGIFDSCEGLTVEIVMEQREEGGNNSFVWQLPTRIKYSNIKVSRPVSKHTPQVMAWFAEMVQTGVRSTTGTISARTADGSIIAEWQLAGVIPLRWTGPTLNLESPKVAMETLELAHHGITPVPPKP